MLTPIPRYIGCTPNSDTAHEIKASRSRRYKQKYSCDQCSCNKASIYWSSFSDVVSTELGGLGVSKVV